MAERPALTPGWFLREVQRLAGAACDATCDATCRDDEQLALAVSGGADSLALLLLAAAAFPGRIQVLTVDHGLRPEATGECAMVARLAHGLGAPADILRLSLRPGGNVQARARDARYRALGERCAELGLRFLLTAHHENDQAETLLLRLARGSGLAGLAAIGATSRLAGVTVLRPLLARRRAELAAIVAAAGWTAAEDPSNADPKYDRTSARTLLAASSWLRPERLSASARHLRQAEEALCWAADRSWDSRALAGDDGRITLDPEGLPAELRRRLLGRGLAAFGAAPDGPALARLLADLDSGRAGCSGPALVRPHRGRWAIGPAPQRRPATSS